MHDPLTGLPNRALALDRLEGALARRRRDGRAVAVLLADLDQFKLVNDSMGHRAGDDLLVALAPRLHDAVRPSDTVARLGGDEFLVVCEQLDGAARGDPRRRARRPGDQPADRARRRASTSSARASASRSPRAPTPTPPTCCATPTPRCTAPRSAAAAATSCSTTCCASASSTGCARRTSCAAGSSTASCASSTSRSSSWPTAASSAVEALVRWQHPERGLLEPVRVHPGRRGVGADRRARRLGADRRLPRRRGAGSGASRAPSRCWCASTRARASSPTPRSRRAWPTSMGRHGLAPGSLALEITESVLMEEAHAPVTVLASLREYGLRLMLDDFGTGLLVAGLPQAVPARRAQDRPLVRRRARPRRGGLGDRRRRSSQMARTLGLIVVAEGVERPEQLERLRELGCDRVQGRLIAEPMPAAQVERLMASAHRLTCASSTATTTSSRACRRAGPEAAAGFLAGDGDGHLDLPRARARPGSPAAASPSSPAAPPRGRLRRSRLLRAGRPTSARCARRSPRSRCCCGSSASPAGACGSRARAADLDGAGPRAPCCTSRAPSRSAPASTSSRCCTPRACARSGSCGAGRTRSRPASRSAFPGSPDQGPGLTDAGRALVRAVRRAGGSSSTSRTSTRAGSGTWPS